uniref:Tyrosine-protein kinase receptor Tie-1 n=1 Tax=Cacopsylla melanoneura TaxID=428564 RepID=A0A8D9EN95_9HEMI
MGANGTEPIQSTGTEELCQIKHDGRLQYTGTWRYLDICFNGGRLKNVTCACPPGFAGNQCELPCGRNRFGQKCSSVCSKSSNECKGMILCTPDYGCTCAPGYHGNQCIQQCQEGTYGADCAQTCDHCKNGCDRYTGACRGDCSKPYLIRPYCKQTHSYLMKAAEIVNKSFNSVQLQVDLTPNNVMRSSANVMIYLVQYREDNSFVWNDGPSEVYSPVMSHILVKGLNPGRVYEFRVILIDETSENHDPSLSKTTKGHTKCSVSVKQEYLNIDSTSNTSIGLSWDKETGPRNTECPTKNYLLEVDEVTDTGYVKTREVVNIKRNSYQLETLSPGQTYYIKLRKITINGETVTISRINITTDDTVDLSKEVVGVTIRKMDSRIKIDWFPIPIYKKYFVKYKLTKYMSCNEDNLKSSLEIMETPNTTTSLSFLNLEPYAYYKLFVTVDKNQMMKEFNSSFITPGTVPTDSPTLSSAPKVTNESIHLFLTNYSDSCERMNGVFKQYKIELYDYSQKLIQSYETEDGKLDITGLESETQYLVKIYSVNHVGFNPTVSLQHNFTTKPNTLVRELTAYKTTPSMIGLRWKVPDMSTILAINIELRSETDSKKINVTSSLHSLLCKPWRGFYCVEVTGLMENNKYSITVDAFSKELPEGSVSKPILAVTKETTPSAVSEITLKHSSDTNMTLSWRIPFTLNGTLRSFDIQLEQLSSFDDKICCQINKTTYPVSEEQEIYSLTLQDIKPASSYQINIRPLARRLGPEAKEIIETPPPRVPFQHVPLVRIDGKKIKFPIQNNSVDASDNVYKTLATEILIIKQIIAGKTNETSATTDSIRAEMSQILGNNNNWVLIQVCKVADVNCTVDVKPVSVGSYESDYPDIIFKILLVQVNQYLSAKSYTILESYLYP